MTSKTQEKKYRDHRSVKFQEGTIETLTKIAEQVEENTGIPISINALINLATQRGIMVLTGEWQRQMIELEL